MGRLESIWGKDAESFRPERFLETGEDGVLRFCKPSPFEFAAFQAGRRTCLGIDMAYLEIKVAVVMILRKYRVLLCDGVTAAYKRTLTLPMSDLRVRLEAL